jgi:hypothetical protein
MVAALHTAGAQAGVAAVQPDNHSVSGPASCGAARTPIPARAARAGQVSLPPSRVPAFQDRLSQNAQTDRNFPSAGGPIFGINGAPAEFVAGNSRPSPAVGSIDNPLEQGVVDNGASGISVFPPNQQSPSAPLRLQAKLAIGAVNDPLEHEADRVAEQVMRTPNPDHSIAPASPRVSRKCAECEEEDAAKTLRTKPIGTAGPAIGVAPPIVHDVLQSRGQPLDTAARASLEPRFGHDFSQIRIHTDAKAQESARAVAAHAYTVGSHIVFGAGRYAPGTDSGRRLLAHELTHVVQQGEFRETGRSAAGVVQRDDDGSNTVNPDQEYQTAVQSGDWPAAAEWLNGFNREDIQARLAGLTQDQITSLHQGALDNPRVGPQSQIAQLTVPGTPLASTAPPVASTAPPPAPAAPPAAEAVPADAPPVAAAPSVDTAPAAAAPAEAQQGPDPNSIAYQQGYADAQNGQPAQPAAVLNDAAIADYNAGYAAGIAPGPAQPAPAAGPEPADAAPDPGDLPRRFVKSITAAGKYVPSETVGQLNELISPKAIATLTLFIGAQAVGLGEAADAAGVLLLVTKIGTDAFTAIGDLKDFFVLTVDGRSDDDFDKAGHALANAIVLAGIDALLALLAAKGAKDEDEEGDGRRNDEEDQDEESSEETVEANTSAPVPGPGTLTAGELAELQAIADKYQTDLDVVGSRAEGTGRNIDNLDLPTEGKGPGTRSDIDVRIDSEADISSGGGLSGDIANVSNGAGKSMVRIGDRANPPFIRIKPHRK